MALVPVTLSASSAPPLVTAEPMRFGALRRVVPTGVVAALLVVLPAGGDAAIVAMLFVGSSLFPLYSLTVAYVNDWIEPGQVMGATATLVRLNGIGAIAGPVAAALLMAAFGAAMFFVAMASVLGAVAAFILYRILVFDALPMDRQRTYVAFPSRATGVAAGLLLRRPAARQGRRSRKTSG